MPEQHDPIDELARFRDGLGTEAPGGSMSTSAARARRRGDQIRRRRTGLVAGGSALAVAAVAVPVFAVVGGDDGEDRDLPAKDPTSQVAPLSEADLIAEDETVSESGTSWTESFSGPGDTQAAFSICAQGPITDLGATDVYQRDLTLTSSETGEPGDGILNESIAAFPSAKEAAAAADKIASWYDTCEPGEADEFRAGGWSAVDVGKDASGRLMLAQYGPATAAPGTEFDVSGRDDLSWYFEAGIVVREDRIAVLTQSTLRTEEVAGDPPVEQMLPVAADRLAPDVIEGDRGHLSEDNLPKNDDAVFLSDSDWVADTTSHSEGDDGAPGNPCLKHRLADLGAIDTWRRDFRQEPLVGPEDRTFLVATVSDFATAEIAAEAYQRILSDVDQCEFSVDAEPDTLDQSHSVDLDDVGDRGRVVTTTWVDAYDPDTQGARIVLDTGVVQLGSRLLVLTQEYVGQDLPIDEDHPDGTTAGTLRNTAPRLE